MERSVSAPVGSDSVGQGQGCSSASGSSAGSCGARSTSRACSPVAAADVEASVFDTTSLELMAHRHREGLHAIKMLAAGGMAGCLAKTAVAPLSRVTILMQVQSMRPHKYARRGLPNNPYLVQSLRKIMQEEGVLALWRGNGATLVHRFPYTAVTFYTNGLLRRRLEAEPLASTFPVQARAFVAGGASASVAITLCYPMDVVKTRLTTQTKTRYYKGITHTLLTILKDEGVRGLYRGLGISLCGTGPMLAFNFAFYDVFFALYAGCGLSPYLHSLVSGACSGGLSSTLLFPLDLLRRQMQMVGLGGRPLVYNTVWQAISHIYGLGYNGAQGYRCRPLWGAREFFRGLAPELLKVVPNNAILFSAHAEFVKWRWPFERPDSPLLRSASDGAKAEAEAKGGRCEARRGAADGQRPAAAAEAV